MTSQEAKQYLESQANIVVEMALQQQWDAVRNWYLETVQNIGLGDLSQVLSDEAKRFFEQMWMFHKGEVPKEEAQTLVREENLHLVDLLEEREQGQKMLSGVKSLRMKYRKKSLQDIIVQVSHATNLSYDNVSFGLHLLAAAGVTAAASWGVNRLINWFKDPNNQQKIEKEMEKKGKKTYPPEDLHQQYIQNQVENNPHGWGVIEGDDEHDDEHWEDSNEDTPLEDDIFTEDGNTFTYSGKVIADREEGLGEWMEKNGWFPNIWLVSDHGNFHLMGR
jgi:hypothetical protein